MTHTTPFADGALARRVEAAIVEDIVRSVAHARTRGHCSDAWAVRIGSGVAAYCGHQHTLNGAFGLGMCGPVKNAEVETLVAFFEDRGTRARIDVCPHADYSLVRLLAGLGFVLGEFETVLAQALPGQWASAPSGGWLRSGSAWLRRESPRSVRVALARTQGERDLWAALVARGFGEDAPSDEETALGHLLARRADSQHFIGYVDAEPAGTGMLTFSGNVALFTSDSTLPALRGLGVQRAVLEARLAVAAERGCDLAVIEGAPGSVSVRNQERAGFRVIYTRASLERALG